MLVVLAGPGAWWPHMGTLNFARGRQTTPQTAQEMVQVRDQEKLSNLSEIYFVHHWVETMREFKTRLKTFNPEVCGAMDGTVTVASVQYS